MRARAVIRSGEAAAATAETEKIRSHTPKHDLHPKQQQQKRQLRRVSGGNENKKCALRSEHTQSGRQ